MIFPCESSEGPFGPISSPDSGSSSSPYPIPGLTELVVIGPKGTAMDVVMETPSGSKTTTTLSVGVYTGITFTATERASIHFEFSLDGYQPAGVTIASDGDSAIVTAVYDAANPITSGYFGVMVKAWSPNDPSAIMEGCR